MWRSWLRSWVRLSIVRKGLSGQSRVWLVVGMISVLRGLQRRFGAKAETRVFGEPLRPGEGLEITYPGPAKKRRRSA